MNENYKIKVVENFMNFMYTLTERVQKRYSQTCAEITESERLGVPKNLGLLEKKTHQIETLVFLNKSLNKLNKCILGY